MARILVSLYFLPEQDIPSAASWNPLLQPQVKLPTVLVQVCAQLSVLAEHSLISVEYIILYNVKPQLLLSGKRCADLTRAGSPIRVQTVPTIAATGKASYSVGTGLCTVVCVS